VTCTHRQDAADLGVYADHPDAIERDYRRFLLGWLDDLSEMLTDRLDRWLTGRRRDITSRARAREDAPLPDDIASWRVTMGQIRRRFNQGPTAQQVEETTQRIGSQADAYNRESQRRIFQQIAGIDPAPAGSKVRPLLDDFAAQNVDLITGTDGLADRVLDQCESEIIEALREGQRHETFAEIVAERLDVGESRAQLIARDQLASLNGQLTKARHEAARINKFRWRTSGDERVRPAHQDLDGRVFRYDDPPSEGMPGTPINCRCVAIPVFDNLPHSAASGGGFT